MSGSDQDGVDRIASGPGEPISFEKAVAFRVTDDWFDGASTPQLTLDRRRSIARTLRDMDVWRCEAVAAISFIDIGARDLHAGEPLDLRDLILQRMAVIGKSGGGANAQNELAAVGARVGDGDRDLRAKFIARSRLALGDAFDLGGVERLEFVLVVALFSQEPD